LKYIGHGEPGEYQVCALANWVSLLVQDEDSVISTLTGFSLNNVLSGLSLSSGDLPGSLGITGLSALDAKQIYNDKWDDDEAVGADQGEDFEDEVDRELEAEMPEDIVKMEEVQSPIGVRPKEKSVRVVKRLVERQKTVYERFPAFEKDKVLDFSELFKGYTVKKSRITKRPLQGMDCTTECSRMLIIIQLRVFTLGNVIFQRVSLMLSLVIPSDRLRTNAWRRSCLLAVSSMTCCEPLR